jgi:hypothetical protein
MVEQEIATRPTIDIDQKMLAAQLEKIGVKVVAVPVPYEIKPPQPR